MGYFQDEEKIEPGKYLIHVSTSPDIRESVEKGGYASILVELK